MALNVTHENIKINCKESALSADVRYGLNDDILYNSGLKLTSLFYAFEPIFLLLFFLNLYYWQTSSNCLYCFGWYFYIWKSDKRAINQPEIVTILNMIKMRLINIKTECERISRLNVSTILSRQHASPKSVEGVKFSGSFVIKISKLVFSILKQLMAKPDFTKSLKFESEEFGNIELCVMY